MPQTLTGVKIEITEATEKYLIFVPKIVKLIKEAAEIKGTGIALRTNEYISNKIKRNNAVIAIHKNELAGFCYIETWENKKYVAHSGLIVSQKFRNLKLATGIKQKAFELSKKKYPNSKIFGLTTSLAVMKINSELGYKPVTFSELTKDDEFWKGCETCNYYDILVRTKREKCLCTGMLYE